MTRNVKPLDSGHFRYIYTSIVVYFMIILSALSKDLEQSIMKLNHIKSNCVYRMPDNYHIGDCNVEYALSAIANTIVYTNSDKRTLERLNILYLRQDIGESMLTNIYIKTTSEMTHFDYFESIISTSKYQIMFVNDKTILVYKRKYDNKMIFDDNSGISRKMLQEISINHRNFVEARLEGLAHDVNKTILLNEKYKIVVGINSKKPIFDQFIISDISLYELLRMITTACPVACRVEDNAIILDYALD